MATDADAQAWIDDVIADGGTVRDETAIDNLVIKLKADGLWAKLDHLWIRKYTGSQIGALKALKSLQDSVNFGATFNDDEGLTGDSVDDFIETKARNLAVTFTQNSAHYGVKYKTGDGLDVDSRSGRIGTSLLRDPNGDLRYRINSANAMLSATQTAGDGFLIAVRESSTAVKLYRNSVQIDSDTDTSQTPNSGDFGSLAWNSNSFSMNTSNAQYFVGGTEEVVSIGSALTAADVSNLDDAIADFYNDVENPAPTGVTLPVTIDGTTPVPQGTAVHHLYADNTDGENEVSFDEVETTNVDGEVTFTGELPAGKVRFIRAIYRVDGNDVTTEQFFSN